MTYHKIVSLLTALQMVAADVEISRALFEADKGGVDFQRITGEMKHSQEAFERSLRELLTEYTAPVWDCFQDSTRSACRIAGIPE